MAHSDPRSPSWIALKIGLANLGGTVDFPLALSLIHPGTVTDFVGLGVGVPIYLWQRMHLRRAAV